MIYEFPMEDLKKYWVKFRADARALAAMDKFDSSIAHDL